MAVFIHSGWSDDGNEVKIREGDDDNADTNSDSSQGIGAGFGAQVKQGLLLVDAKKNFKTVQVKMKSKDSASAQVSVVFRLMMSDCEPCLPGLRERCCGGLS